MGVIVTNEFRNGSRLELDNEPYIIVEFQHVKPGKGGSFVRTKLKSLKSGAVIERTFRTGEKFDEPDKLPSGQIETHLKNRLFHGQSSCPGHRLRQKP